MNETGKISKKTVFLLTLGILVIAGLALVLISFNKFLPKELTFDFVPARNEQNTNTETPEQFETDKFLYKSYPDFDNLTLKDLPNFSDVRRVFEYNDNLIIMGVEQIIEYNKNNRTYVRTSLKENPKFYTATKIGNYLYASDNGDFFNGIQPVIYKVDLKTGKVVDTIKSPEDIDYGLTNLTLHQYKNDLWVSTKDHIIKFDTDKKQFTKAYSLQDIGYTDTPTCDNAPVMVDEQGIVKVVEFACKNFISTYDYDNDAWSIQSFDKIAPDLYINKTAEDFGLNLPKFGALSKKVNNMYYALSDRGIYTITQKSLPTVLYDEKIEGLSNETNFIDTLDGEMFVAVSNTEVHGMIPESFFEETELTELLKVRIIDVINNTETELIGTSIYKDETGEKYQDLLTNLYQAKSEIKPGIYTIKDINGKVLIEVNLNTKELKLTETN